MKAKFVMNNFKVELLEEDKITKWLEFETKKLVVKLNQKTYDMKLVLNLNAVKMVDFID